MESNKIYVDVEATFTKDGVLRPRSIIWEDGTVYEITKLKHIQRAASLRAGGVGMRYTCLICGQEKHLFYEGDNRWFVEKK